MNKKHVLPIKNTTENQKYTLSTTKRLDLKEKTEMKCKSKALFPEITGNYIQCYVQ